MNNQIPKNEEYEKNIISAFFFASNLAEQKDMFDRIADIISENDFYNGKYKSIFYAIAQLLESNVEIEASSLATRLIENHVNQNDAINTIAELQTGNATTSNIEEYAKDIREKAILRNLIDLLNISNQNAHDPASMPEDLIANIRKTLDSIEDTHDAINFMTIKEALNKVIIEIQEASKNKQSDMKVGAISTGFSYLDRLTKGLQQNNLIIIAARPAAGKTAFALNIAANAAQDLKIKNNKHVVVFNMEMTEEQMMFRLLSARSTVPMDKLQTGNLTTAQNGNDFSTDWAMINEAQTRLSELPIELNATPGITINEIRSNLRALDAQLKHNDPDGGIGLVIVDYLQLIEPDAFSRDGRQNEVSKISRSLKKLAGELEVPVIALSQLSRGVENRENKRPRLSDLRDSGAIEQDADIVMFLYRDDYYDQNGHSEDDEDYDASSQPNVTEIEVIVAKNRQGANDTVRLIFKKDTQSIVLPMPKSSS
ncbi:MAG: replicative DNA helicase [Lactobacillaceae bacterium]|jgi:replicative DNA helicase|nr:replicative DNA helicase [Lactobacillaceae bacterium]